MCNHYNRRDNSDIVVGVMMIILMILMMIASFYQSLLFLKLSTFHHLR